MSSRRDLDKLAIVEKSSCGGCCSSAQPDANRGFSRRRFLQGTGVAVGGLALAATQAQAASGEPIAGEQPFPRGATLHVKPILVFDRPVPQDRTSWRGYGGIHTPTAAQEESVRIQQELKKLQKQADFPVEIKPLEVLDSQAKLKQVTTDGADLCILYAAGGCTEWPLKVPMIMFVRHRSGPFYLGFEIAHWRFLRQNGDHQVLDGFDCDDVVVDSCDELLWRLRAMYGLKNARGTKMLTIGGLCAYSTEAQENGPRVAKDLWDYDFANVSDQQFTERLAAARADSKIAKQVEAQTAAVLNMPNVKLETDRKFVFNSYMALHVVRQLLKETGATNFGFARCMGHQQIAMLDTPACLVLSLANDEGYTAYCHTDLSHTMPGVLLRWIASRPTFVCNSHFPHDGIFFVAHCQAPRRMNGKEFEPATIMTHYESDYGAACRTHYTHGQEVTVIIPDLHCTQWQGFRGKIVGTPTYPACRSQIEIQVDGDWRKLLHEMQGFHTQIVYGDYLREVGYALKKIDSEFGWQSYSDIV